MVIDLEKEEKIRTLQREDYESLSLFLEERTGKVFTRDFWFDRFSLWWEHNPSWNSSIARGWILHSDGGAVKGFFGNIPLKYQIQWQEQTVCTACSWYVADDIKYKSLEFLNYFLKQEYLLLDTTPSDKVVKIIEKFGFKHLKQDWINKEIIVPVDLKEFCDFISHKMEKKHRAIFYFSQIVFFVVTPLLEIILWFLRKNIGVLDEGYMYREINYFGEDFELFWKNLKRQYLFLAARDPKNLNWLFCGSPYLKQTRKIIEVRHNDELMGFAVTKEVPKKIGEKIFLSSEIVDFIFLNQNKEACRTALSGLYRMAQSSDKKIMYIRTHIFSEIMGDIFKKVGAVTVCSQARYMFRPLSRDSKEEEAIEQRMLATPIDGDRCFFP